MSPSPYSWMEPYPTEDVGIELRQMDWYDYTAAATVGWIAFSLLASLPLVYVASWGLGLLAPVVLLASVPVLLAGCVTYGMPATVLGVVVVRAVAGRFRGEVAPVLTAGLVGGLLSGLWVQLLARLGYLPPFLSSTPGLWIAAIAGVSTAFGYGWTLTRIRSQER